MSAHVAEGSTGHLSSQRLISSLSRRRDPRYRDRGAADALELVLLAPVVVGLALLVVSLGRQVDARAQVQSAAEAAAQAAVLERDPDVARARMQAVVDAMLTDPDTCGDKRVDPMNWDFRPGGSVSVQISCFASNRGLESVQRDDRRFTVTATARIDFYRSAG